MKVKNIIKLAATAGITAAAIPAIKKDFETPQGKRRLYDGVNSLANGLCTAVGAFLPSAQRDDILDFTPECQFSGTDKFISEPLPNAKWHLGYSKVSILPEDLSKDKYFIAGYLAFPPNVANGALDDQMIRCISLWDGTERGTVVFAVIDCVGISNADIEDIRNRLKDFAEEKNIVSINISATHSHSCIDTMGVWGELTTALKVNPSKIKNGETDFSTGRNAEFMENLKVQAVNKIKEAAENMKPGKLYKGIQDGSKFMRDKRPPDVMITDIVSLVFRPDDGSTPTRAVIMSAHPTQFGGSNKIVSGDYPYYLCGELEKNGENALFFQGAELSIATERGGNVPDGLNRTEQIIEYGRTVGRFCLEAELSEIEPFINIKHRKILIEVSNKIFMLLAKIQVIDNVIRSYSDNNSKIMIETELGYAEIGKNLKLALIPGEIAPEIIVGGCYNAVESYDHSSWIYPSLNEIANAELTVIGLCNDEIAYIIPDNDFGSIIAPKHYEESVSTGKYAASKIVKEFKELINSIERQ